MVLNYSKEVKDFDFEIFQEKEKNNENTCDCQNSKFKDSFHQHVLTGDLSIIQNDSLRWLLQQGPNFREQKSKSNFNRIWNNLKSGISECIEKWAKLENKPIEILTEWKIKLLKKLRINFNRIKANPQKKI